MGYRPHSFVQSAGDPEVVYLMRPLVEVVVGTQEHFDEFMKDMRRNSARFEKALLGRAERDARRREVYEEGLMGPFKREEVVDELPEKVRDFLAVQAQDGKLWFGDDLDYVRQQLRDLHCLLELPQ